MDAPENKAPRSILDLEQAQVTADEAAAARAILRRARQLQKPKDWQDFQARCVVLYREELNDPNCKEYGRPGQEQNGIDILGRRGERFVGIQCRLVQKPLTEKKIRKDVNAALALPIDLSEIIFATTAPDSTRATLAALQVEQEVKKRGRDVKIELFGWEALQQVIARHDRASAYFSSNLSEAYREQPVDPQASRIEQKIDRLTELVVTAQSTPVLPTTGMRTTAEGEDPALHAKIDAYRDLRNDGEPSLALRRLSDLTPSIDPKQAPYALFRVKTNIACALLDLGKEREAAALWEEAYELRRDDPRAIANLGLARLVSGHADEAMRLAQGALQKDEKSADAVNVLLQAAARSSWSGDPTDLIPAALRGTSGADVGLLEFKRIRNDPSWVDDARAFAVRHTDRYFAHMAALSVIERVTKDEVFSPGAIASLLPGELANAADTLKREFVDIEKRISDTVVNLSAFGNNAAVALRIAGRYPEAIEVLNATIRHIGSTPHLVRMLGVLQAAQGDIAEGMATLATIPEDGEAQLARAEMQSASDKNAALVMVRAIDPNQLTGVHREHRATLWAELSLSLGNESEYHAAIDELRSMRSKAIVELLAIEGEVRFRQLSVTEATKRLAAFAKTLGANEQIVTRLTVAQKLSSWGDNATASEILHGHVALSRPSSDTKLYLETLAAARRDESFTRALALASDATRADPDVCWIVAAHAWNTGDMATSEAQVDALLRLEPRNLRGTLLKADILVRQDRIIELRSLLERPLESYPTTRLSDRFRLVQLLTHFGYVERSLGLAYLLLLQNRDQSRAWMALANAILARPRENDAKLFQMDVVGPDAAVNVRLDDGKERFFVIEPDTKLRALDPDALEPDHNLARALTGLAIGAVFELPDGRIGEVTQVRHKYIARFHDVLAKYEERFPTIFGFRTFSIDPSAKNGLDTMIAQLKERHDFVTEETLDYVNGDLPLGVLAHRVGADIIDTALGVAETGNKIKVAAGNEEERVAALLSIRRNRRSGCILDPLAFWTLHRLGELDTVVKLCGPVHLCYRTLDTLRSRKGNLHQFGADGLKSMSYEGGKIALTEVSSETIRALAEDIDKAIDWANRNAKIEPVHALDSLPDSVRQFLQRGGSDLLDECVLAFQTGLLLVSDDHPIRKIASGLGIRSLAWVQALLLAAADDGALSVTTYARHLATLLEAGQTYLGVSPPAFVAALDVDMEGGVPAPGRTFRRIATALGGKSADPDSHASVTLNTIGLIWSNHRFRSVREPATGLLLESVIRDRSDYQAILGSMFARVIPGRSLARYVRSWLVGHFLLIE